MILPPACDEVVVWAYPGREEVPCLARVGSEVMLCGRFLNPGVSEGSVPALQPFDPEPACERCVARLDELLGGCRVCGVELVADEQGLAPRHGECAGVGLPLRRMA